MNLPEWDPAAPWLEGWDLWREDAERLPCLPQPQLLDRQHQFLVLVASGPGKAISGKARDEYQGVIHDRPPDFRLPVLTWPQIRSVPPYRDPGFPEYALQPVNLRGVFANIGQKGMPRHNWARIAAR